MYGQSFELQPLTFTISERKGSKRALPARGRDRLSLAALILTLGSCWLVARSNDEASSWREAPRQLTHADTSYDDALVPLVAAAR
jgi:hypothetical protein